VNSAKKRGNSADSPADGRIFDGLGFDIALGLGIGEARIGVEKEA
jgi:hypothetical protein